MHAFDVLGDPVRRRLLELMVEGERTAGQLTATIVDEFHITQPAVSRQLRILRESGFADVRPDGTRRLYSVRSEPLQAVDSWLERYRHLWSRRLDALETELVRARRQRRTVSPTSPRSGGRPPQEETRDD